METVITSASNPNIRRLRKLRTSSKARREENAYIAEGIHLVKSILASSRKPLVCFYAESAPGHAEVAELVEVTKEAGVARLVIADSLFETVTTLHASVGIAVVFEAPEVKAELEINKNTVVLEDVQDPGNVGTILRTAAAVGVESVVLSPGSASPWSPSALRAGMGAQFSLDIHVDVDLVKVLSKAEIPVIATSLDTDSKSLYSLELSQPVVWVFGNEGQGVSDELIGAATTKISIPQASSTVESLNVAAAAAVCLYEQYRQSIL